jgi:hypothetical protein
MPRRWRYFGIAWFVNYALKTGMEGVAKIQRHSLSSFNRVPHQHFAYDTALRNLHWGRPNSRTWWIQRSGQLVFMTMSRKKLHIYSKNESIVSSTLKKIVSTLPWTKWLYQLSSCIFLSLYALLKVHIIGGDNNTIYLIAIGRHSKIKYSNWNKMRGYHWGAQEHLQRRLPCVHTRKGF